MKNELIQAIDRLVVENTFSLEALEAIKNFKDKAESLQKSVDVNSKTIVDLSKEVDELKKARDQMTILATERFSRINELEAKIADADKAIYEADKQTAVAQAYRDAMTIVFKPNAVRETVSSTIPIPLTTGSGGCTNTYIQPHQQIESISREDV